MCDETGKLVNQTSEAKAQAASEVTAQASVAATVKPQVTARKDVVTATAKAATHKDADSKKAQVVDPEFARAENEDDDGYDPYSDRRPVSDPLFERDPWS
ncbi:MAG: hypothetical protein KH176_04995 [Atopobium sp.]|nr:hypothetical protein [Atopobium sp.]